MAKIRVLGKGQMGVLVRQDRMFRDAMMSNRRKATCKVCGNPIEKDNGIRWFKFAPNNDWFFNIVFLCNSCDKEWK